MTQQYPFLLGKSLILTGLLCLVETWMIAVSCARTIRVYKRLLLLSFVLMFFSFALLVLNQLVMKQPSLMNIADSLMFQVGRMIEEFSILSVFIFIGVMFLSFMMMYSASHRLEMKESLVKEAVFWEEFEGKHIQSSPIVQKEQDMVGTSSINGRLGFSLD